MRDTQRVRHKASDAMCQIQFIGRKLSNASYHTQDDRRIASDSRRETQVFRHKDSYACGEMQGARHMVSRSKASDANREMQSRKCQMEVSMDYLQIASLKVETA